MSSFRMRTLLVLSLAASPALCLVRPMVALGSPQRAPSRGRYLLRTGSRAHQR